MSRLAGWFLIGAVCIAHPARADLFVLSSGGQVEGELLNRDEKPRANYVVKTLLGGQVTLAKAQVERVVVRSDAQRRYDESLPKMPHTVEGQSKMAEWCRKNGLDAERQYHLQEILRLDPEHEVARHGLGYSKINGKWKTVEDHMRDQGYVRHKNTWRLPQEIVILESNEGAKKDELEWKRRIRILHNKIGDKGGDRALEELRNIRDPAAAEPIIDLLNSKDEPRELRMMYLDILGRMGSGVANGALIKRALQDDDDLIRDRALDRLEKGGRDQAVRSFIAILKAGKDNPMINRAGVGLGRMQDPEATLPLIDALITRHHIQVTQGGGMSAGFGGGSGGSGGGLSMGGKPVFVDIDAENHGVLAGLTAIHPGVNYAFDKLHWKQWWVQQHTPKEFELRRDK